LYVFAIFVDLLDLSCVGLSEALHLIPGLHLPTLRCCHRSHD